MEERSIQEIRGSFAIYLPRSWCVKNELYKGSKILIRELGNKLLIESSKIAHKSIEISINIDTYDKNELRYIIISLYILGADTVKLESRRSIKPKIRSMVRDVLKFLNGFEIFDMGKNYIIIKQTIPGIDIENQIYEAINKTRSMFSYIYETILDEGKIDYDTINDLSSIDDEIDRARNSLERQLNRSLITLNIPNKLNLKQLSILVNIARISERIADHLYYIANLCIENTETCRPENISILKDLQKLFDKLTSYIKIMLDNKNKTTITASKDLDLKISDLVSIIENKNSFHRFLDKMSLNNSMLIYHLGRIYDYITDIAENLLDLNIESYIDTY